MVDKQNYGLFFSLIALTVLVLDQISKYFILVFNPRWNVFFFDIHLITNTGAGFGIFQGKTLWLGLISLLVALGIILYYHKIPKQYPIQLLSALFLGGVIGNLLDRFFRGHVIDFIDFRFWPAFNLADAAISVAVIGLIWSTWKEEVQKKKVK